MPPDETVSDPRSKYAAPADDLKDDTLSTEQKRTILKQWAEEVDDRLRAEEEGMSVSDPMGARHEAALAGDAE
jgi:hypothetical protein